MHKTRQPLRGFNRNRSELKGVGALELPPKLLLRSAVQVLQFSDGKYPAEAQRNDEAAEFGDFQKCTKD